MISGTCHCGAIEIRLPTAPETATHCNCSICKRLGAIWAFYPLDAVRVTVAADQTDEYVWGKGTRRFIRCRACGCVTHVLPAAPRPDSSIEVNLRLFDAAALGKYRLRYFDGAVTWKYTDDAGPPSDEGDA